MLLGILQCDTVDTDLQASFGDYPDMLKRLLTGGNEPSPWTFHTYDLPRGQMPPSTVACDAWLMTGSRWSAYDPDEWIARAHRFVRKLHDERRPLVAICFGHQLVCRALGGCVDKAEAGWGVGVHTTRIIEHQAWMKPELRAMSLVVSHQDQVLAAPAAATVLAGHAFCPLAMLQIGDHILTLQGHPDFAKGYSRALQDRRRETIGEATYQEGIASLEKPVDAEIVAGWIRAFLHRCAQESATG